MAVVFAQLIIDGVSKGVHVFAVPIRDYDTHDALPGVVVGDCGKKISLDGIDNGFIIFNNYKVPYDCMLDKWSQITVDGKFKTSIKNKDKRLGLMLVGLIRGRSAVVIGSEQNMRSCLTIALRFGALRKQFGNSDGVEIPILDYELHRYRLIPHLAKMFAIKAGVLFLVDNYVRIFPKLEVDPECDDVSEHHAILSALKSISSWYGISCAQDCRESLGGLGYSSYSAIGRIRANQDIHLTWEGDNSVLIQQTGKFIFKQIQRTFKGLKISSQTLSILKTDYEEVKAIKSKFETCEQLETEQVLMELIETRVNIILHRALTKVQENTLNARDMLEA